MTLDASDLAYLRRWVATSVEDDAGLQAIHTRDAGLSLDDIALEVLETQYAGMEADAASHSLAGELSENWTENMRSLRSRINRLRQKIASADETTDALTPTAVLTGRVVRADLRP